jgi:uncharacterized protein YdhG (YjbR/CyaY superfamily)
MATLKLTNIDAYIATFQPEVQEVLQQIRSAIQVAAPDAREVISYNMPGFRMGEVKVWFAAHKKHIGMYPMYNMEDFPEDLSPYRANGTKDSIHFPLDKPMPLALIGDIVRFKFRKREQ